MDGMDEEFAAFEACYRGAFGDRLHVVRGNHDAYRGQDSYAGDEVVDLPGVRLALLDTVIPSATTGRVTAEQLDWLDTVAAEADRPVIVMGHHQNWVGRRLRDETAGLLRDQPGRLRRARWTSSPGGRASSPTPPATPTATGSATSPRTGVVPFIEVACVKDFPGLVGRVPRLRGRHHAGPPPHLHAGGPGLERAVPAPVPGLRHRLRDATRSAGWRTGVSPSRPADRAGGVPGRRRGVPGHGRQRCSPTSGTSPGWASGPCAS